MNRNYSRIAALVLFVFLAVSPVAFAAPRQDRGDAMVPRDRVVRIVKKIKNLVRGFVSQDEWLPPKP
jgi:hypothetical protein